MKILGIIFLCVILTSCWARRCPMKSCKVTMEHKHDGGVYRGGSFITAKKYWFWSKRKDVDGKEITDKSGKKKTIFKKLLPWEKGD